MNVPEEKNDLTAADLDDDALFETQDEALAAAKRDSRPRVYVRYCRKAKAWHIEHCVWSQLPHTAYRMSGESHEVAVDLAGIWELSVEDIKYAYANEIDLRLMEPSL